jgi:hypothetical protein
MPFCGHGNQCPALAQSKFVFHVRGDSFGSNRLMDTLLSGTVPIFTRTQQYSVTVPWIDWNQLSYFLDMENSTKLSFSVSLGDILRDEEGYKKRHQKVLENRHLFDWTSLYPFDSYMYMLQAHLYPETRHASSPWSVLILSPPLDE